MKKFLALILALVMSMSLIACGGNDAPAEEEAPADDGAATEEVVEPIVLRVAVQQNEEHQTCKAVRRIAEKVEAETNGGLVLDIYSDSVLGDYSVMFDEVMLGTVDMAVQSISGEYDPGLEVFYLPYLFTNYEESRQVFTEGSNTYGLIQDKFDSNNLVYLGCFVEGFVQMASVDYIDNFADINVKKDALIRCAAIECGRLAVDAMGFPTVTIPYSDLYTSMQTGVCDGWQGGTAELNYVGFRDIIHYLYRVNQLMENNSGFMNKDSWNALPAEYQEVLYNAFMEEAAASFDRAETTDVENMQKLKDYGIEIVEFSQDELNLFADTVRTQTWDTVFDYMGEDVKAAVYADMGW